jgi:hypothetical protein
LQKGCEWDEWKALEMVVGWAQGMAEEMVEVRVSEWGQL